MNDKNQLTVSAEDMNLMGKNVNIIKQNINYHTEHQRLWSKSKYTETHKNKNQHQTQYEPKKSCPCVILCHKNVWGDSGKSPDIPGFCILSL